MNARRKFALFAFAVIFVAVLVAGCTTLEAGGRYAPVNGFQKSYSRPFLL